MADSQAPELPKSDKTIQETAPTEAPAVKKTTSTKKRPASGKKGKKKKKPPLSAKIKTLSVQMVGGMRALLQGVYSPDTKTRRMSWLFFVSVLGMFGVVTLSVHRGLEQRWIQTEEEKALAEAQAKNISKFVAKEKSAADQRGTSLDLGRFLVELTPAGGTAKNVPGVMNLAEIHITVVCDTRATCDRIDTHRDQVRDQLTETLVAMDRESLMSSKGKMRIKASLIKRINAWLKGKKVKDVFFTKLVIS